MADIGDKLRSARKAKGMSIEDVEKITKIQRRYLTAIENDDLVGENLKNFFGHSRNLQELLYNSTFRIVKKNF